MITPYSKTAITKTATEFHVPLWVMDDVETLYPEVNNWIKSETDENVTFDILYLKQFEQLRKQIYWQCRWYDELIHSKVPVIKSKIYNVGNDKTVMRDILIKELEPTPKFFRFCNASPKDIVTPIFNDKSDVLKIMKVFETSPRTNYMLDDCCAHLVVKPVAEINYEIRCFWHKYKLRAVSGPHEFLEDDEKEHIKKLVLQFFKHYEKDIPYNSATIDIGIFENKVFIIELNSFGIDMMAGSGHFRWDEDFMILYNSENPVFRFHEKFKW